MIFGDQNNPSRIDPIMIHPKGHEVQVPAKSVPDLLNKGYTLKDETWLEKQTKPGPPPNPFAPYSRYKIEEELSEEFDSLEVTKI